MCPHQRSWTQLLGSCLLLAAIALLAGCGKTPPPEPLAFDEIPAALAESFKQPGGELKTMLDDTTSALQTTNLMQAAAALQAICGLPEISTAQRTCATRALLAVNAQIQTQADSGSSEAAGFIRARQSDK